MSFYVTTVAVENLDTIPLLAMRWGISALIFVVLILAGIVRVDISKPGFKTALITALSQPCLYSIFETNGIAMTSTSESSIMIALIPCVAMIMGSIVFKRKIKPTIALSIVIAFTGVVIATVFSPKFSTGGSLIGYLYMALAVICGGAYAHLSAKSGQTYTSMETTCIMAISGGIFFNALNFILGYGTEQYVRCFTDIHIAGPVVFLGVFCSCVCYLIMNYLTARIDPAGASNMSASFTTTVGVISGIVLAGDPWGWYTILGLVMTLTGVWITSSAASKQ